MTSSEDSPLPSTETNGGRNRDSNTRWRSHFGMIRRSTGRSNRKVLISSLMWGSASGSYFKWRNTEATDVRCEMIVEGSRPSRNRCIMYELKWWLLTSNTCHRFDLQNDTNLDQWDSYTWREDSLRHLDIILAASREWPLDLRMARRVSTRVDLTAGSAEFRRPRRLSKPLESADRDPLRTVGWAPLVLAPSALDAMTLPAAVERSESPLCLVTEQSSTGLEGPSWMAGTRTGGPSRCPKAWTWNLSTPSWGPDTATRT